MAIGTRVLADGAFAHGLEQPASFEFGGRPFPTLVRVSSGTPLLLGSTSSHCVVVHSGIFHVALDGCAYPLADACHGFFHGAARILGEGRALIFSGPGRRHLPRTGGPIEELGRICHADGSGSHGLQTSAASCASSRLDFLHLPAESRQAMRSMPSLRAGLVLSGRGQCITGNGALPLGAGILFCIPAWVKHGFRGGDEPLRLAIYRSA